MRNEIFEKISQSRKRYLAELNHEHNRKEAAKEKPAKAIKQIKPIERFEYSRFQLDSFKQFMNTNWGVKKKLDSILQKIPLEGIKGKLNELTTGLQQRLRKSNQRFSSNSDKLMEGFVSYSNRIFEDRYERIDSDSPNRNSLVLQATSSRQISWEFADPITHRDFIPAYSESRLGEFLKKIENGFNRGWRSFLFSLEFDGASLEVDQNKFSENVVHNENAKIIEKEKSQFGLSRLLYVVDIARSRSCKLVLAAVDRARRTVNWIRLFFLKTRRFIDLVSLENLYRYRLTKFVIKPKSEDFDITQRSRRLG